MPFTEVPHPLVPDGQLVISGGIEVLAGTRVARIVGLGGNDFSLQPPGTLFGNLSEVVRAGVPWSMATFAGLGLSYLSGVAGGNAPEIKGISGQAFSVSATSHTYTYPPGLVAGDVLAVAIATGGLTTITPPAAWTHVGSQATSASIIAVYKRVITGLEGATETVTFGTASGAIVHDWLLDKASGDMEVTSAVNDSGAGTSLDIGSVTPSWAVAEATNTFYLAVIGLDIEAASTISAFPAGYIGTGQDAIASATASINCRIGFAYKTALNQTEDPSAFTYGAARSAGLIVAIRPANAGRINWDGVGVRKNSTGATISTQRRLNLIEGTGITLAVVDDPTDGEVDITITNSGAGGTAGWDDTLLIDNHSGASNPIIDDAQFIQWGTLAGGVATGQARTNNNFLFEADKNWHLNAGEDIQLVGFDTSLFRITAGGLTVRAFDSLNLTSDDSDINVTALDEIVMTCGGNMTVTPSGFLHMGSSTLTNDIALLSAGVIDIASATDVINATGATGVNVTATAGSISLQAPVVILPTGFLRFTEAAASTPSMAAAQALFWVKNDTPNNPFFTDDTNADRQIATFPIPLTGFATIANDTFLGNVSGSTAAPVAVNLSTLAGAGLVFGTHTLDVAVGAGGSLVVGANDIQRGALTGAITATQDSNTTAFGALAAKSVLANATNASAVPAALAGSAAFQHIRVNAANTGLEWSVFTTGDFPANVVPVTALATIATDTFLANITAGTATPTAVAFLTVDSTSIIWDPTSHTFQLGAHTGDVTSTQNGLALTIAADAVTNAKLADAAALSVKGNATNASANPTDIASAADDTVFRRTATTLNWGGLTVGMAANDLWTYAKIQNVSATSRILGRITAGAGDIEELTGTQATSLLDVFGAAKGLVPASAGGTVNFLRADGSFAVPPGGSPGHVIRVDGVDQTQRAAANFLDTTDILFTPTDDAVNGETELRATFANVAANTFAANATAGVGPYTPVALSAESIPARTSGNIGQITSAAQSMLMRAAGSLFFATAAADQVLRRSGSGDLGFGTLVTNNIGADQITNALLADMTAKSVKANATNAAANPTDLAATVALQHLRNNSANTALEWSVLQAADFPVDTVPIASLQTIAANTVLANATASTDNATAVAVGTNTVLGRVGANIVAAQLVNAQVTTNTLAYTKLAQTASGRKLLGTFTDGAGDISELDQLTVTQLMALPATNNSHGIMWEDEDFSKGVIASYGTTNVTVGNVVDVFSGATGNTSQWFFVSSAGTSVIGAIGGGTAGHKGIINIATGSTSSNSCSLFLARDGSSPLGTEGVLAADDVLSIDWYIMLPEVTSKFVMCGLGADVVTSASVFGAEAACFFFDTNVGTTWHCIVRAASTTNLDANSGVTATANAWVKLTIRRQSTTLWDFYINNALVSSSTATGPSGLVIPGINLFTRAAAAKNVRVDRCRIFVNDRSLFD